MAPSSYMNLEKMQHWPHLPHMPHSHPGDLILELLERAARTGDVKDRLQAFNATLLAIHVSSHDEVCAYSVMRLLGEACKSND